MEYKYLSALGQILLSLSDLFIGVYILILVSRFAISWDINCRSGFRFLLFVKMKLFYVSDWCLEWELGDIVSIPDYFLLPFVKR